MIAKHFKRASIAVAFAIGLAACGESAEPLVAAVATSTFPANATAVAGTSVSIAPGVKVTTAKGKAVPNVPVTFAVTAGAGTILGASQTTNANGEATVVYWILGNTAGANTLTATVGTLPAVTISATGTTGPAAKLGFGTAPSATAANRAAFPTQPVIQVQDQYGNFVATSTAAVTAAMASGTGTLSGTTTVSAVGGLATFTNLSVAGTAGAKTILFAVTGLASAQATITTTAGAAASIAIKAGNNRSAAPGAATTIPPSVKVVDADSNPVNGVGINFAVTGGGGSIAGASASSNVSGVATSGTWTLGPSLGANTASATSAALPGVAATFNAVGTDIVLSSISPATLSPGITATITGQNFGATIGSNSVTIDGAAATVTAASPTSLTVVVPPLPCVSAHDGDVALSVNGGGAAVATNQLSGATQLTLAVGQSAIFSTAATSRCTELSNTSGTYYVSVYNSNTVYDATGAQFELKGTAGGTSSIMAAVNAGPPSRGALPLRAITSFPVDPEMAARDKADRAHVQFLERELEMLRTNGPAWQRARGNRAAVRGIAPVNVPASYAVGDPATVKLPDLRSNICTNFLNISGRVAYVGTKSIIIEDNANSMAGFIDSTYTQIGNEFDDVMFPILSNNYGNALAMDAALDNNGKIIMVFTDKMNPGANPGHELGTFGLAGFVTSVDMQTTATCPTSNNGEYFYAISPTSSGTINTVGSPPRWRWSMRSTIIHEVKHIVSVAERASRNGVGGPYEVSWIEETTARMSEELYERARYSFTQKSNIGYGSASNQVGPYCGVRLTCSQPRGIVRVFEELAAQGTFGGWYSSPHDYSPFGRFSSSDFSFYSTGWSLVRWMIDASANSEATILKGMTQEPTKTGIANVEQYTGLTFAAAQPKWLLSMLVDDYPAFTPADATIKQPSWNLRDVFSGYDADFTVPWTLWPLVQTSTTYGSFSINARVRPGTGTAIQLSGAQLTPQLLELKASGVAAAAPAELRLAIIRIQ